MIFLDEGWFEFKGIKSSDMGIRLQGMPMRTVPGRKLQRKSIAGRNGGITYGDASFDDAAVSIQCDVREPANLTDILAWLTGNGLLRFSDEPNYAYDAWILSGFSRSSIAALLAGQRFTVEWTCAPLRRLYPEAENMEFYAEATFDNPGTAPALPRVEIHGSGAFALHIGGQSVFFTDVAGGIIVDSELGDAFTLDGLQLANEHMDGPIIEIQPGPNAISWTNGGEDEDGNATSGSINSVIIAPRWRYI